tara:strand:+ start:243 stop:455 length:213 start_codon:yes stop_codon:yes gene_type:complete
MNRFKVGDLVKLGPPDSMVGMYGVIQEVCHHNEISGPNDDWFTVHHYTVLIDGELYRQIPQERLTLVSES